MKTTDNKMDNYEEHLEVKVDQIESPKLEDYVLGFEASKLGEIIRELREKKHLTLEELAQKCGTTPSYISAIENNSLDVPVSTLSSIVREGLSGHLELRISL
jgi:HTH-type transcriptional regulator / antitoxin HipB